MMDEYDSFFDLLSRVQGGRMEDQRAPGPRLSGDFTPTGKQQQQLKQSISLASQPQHRHYHDHQHQHQNTSATSSQAGMSPPLSPVEQVEQQPSHARVYETPVVLPHRHQHPSPLLTGKEATPSSTSTLSTPRHKRSSSDYTRTSLSISHDSFIKDNTMSNTSTISNSNSGNESKSSVSRSSTSRASSTRSPLRKVPMRKASSMSAASQGSHRASRVSRDLTSNFPQTQTPMVGLDAPQRPLPNPASHEMDPAHVSPRKPTKNELEGYSWYIGKQDRKQAEDLLKHWPAGTFVVRQGRSSKVITLKFPINDDKIFFHVRVTHEPPLYRIADSECFKSVPELVDFYCDNPERFFRGMSQQDRQKQRLIPYRPLPKLQLKDFQGVVQSDA
eukprot:m.16803 g.16803  ORF g.16803 m.16803 type:complete len:388 (-) comp8155_c1_seq1:199-1362(-)